jgi:hypothetical protein
MSKIDTIREVQCRKVFVLGLSATQQQEIWDRASIQDSYIRMTDQKLGFNNIRPSTDQLQRKYRYLAENL